MSDGTIDVICKKCGKTLVIPAEYAGKKITCTKCHHEFTADYHERHGVPVVPTGTPDVARDENLYVITANFLWLFGAILALIAVACIFNLLYGIMKGGELFQPVNSGLMLIAILLYWLTMEVRAIRKRVHK